ncbi:MAG: 1,4-dihydroxy-2-naphthoate octaprenyltransferase [Verrucomicrobiota bacterium]
MSGRSIEIESGSWRAWILATRPKTLPAAIVPVWAGAVLSFRLSGAIDWFLLTFTVLSALSIQIATNFFNDVIDFRKGTDTAKRVGPTRAAASGLIHEKAMMLGGITMLFIAVALGTPLVAAGGWPILLIGVVSLFLSYGYTGGPFPLAYRGMGEAFVVVFFGLIAVGGSVLVQTGHWPWSSVLLGLQVGLYSTVLIAVNNLRDVEEDRASGKKTLAVKLGAIFAKWEIAAFCLLPLLMGVLWIPLEGWLGALLFPLLLLPLSLLLTYRVASTPPSEKYNKFLAMGALQLIGFVIFFTIALVDVRGIAAAGLP